MSWSAPLAREPFRINQTHSGTPRSLSAGRTRLGKLPAPWTNAELPHMPVLGYSGCPVLDTMRVGRGSREPQDVPDALQRFETFGDDHLKDRQERHGEKHAENSLR